ncbi:unnamed protein product [Paramecium sonneborni]|uniref:Uncharacterized protein n=1 Tax=Paramecium sonneborni TaxID=65129 RepID=A0A8S1NXV7_9CILI|nr:unnamed protein product [Paramecium sonneborni]
MKLSLFGIALSSKQGLYQSIKINLQQNIEAIFTIVIVYKKEIITKSQFKQINFNAFEELNDQKQQSEINHNQTESIKRETLKQKEIILGKDQRKDIMNKIIYQFISFERKRQQ